MILKCVAFLFAAIALAGCCVSGNGCSVPLPGTLVAWDGLGSAPTETSGATEYRPRQKSRPKKEIVIGPIGEGAATSDAGPQSHEWWAQREAADRAAESALTKKLIICRGCSPPPARDDDATGSVPR
jgi:hypothetical protein